MMDTYGWLIATMHQLLGHHKAAIALGVPSGDPRDCLICAYERNPTDDAREAVIAALSKK